MLSCLAEYLERRFNQLPLDSACEDFLQLLLQVAQSQSLMVSIPIMVAWSRLIASPRGGVDKLTAPMHPQLLELCLSRMVRYENLPEDSTDSIYLFLIEDTDTIPERHAFLVNYRRYSSRVIEAIVHYQPFHSIAYILGRTETMLQNLYDGLPSLDSE